MAFGRQRYPETSRLPVHEAFGEIAFDDPYEWLEPSIPETLAWQDAQNSFAANQLRSWPGFEKLCKAIDSSYVELDSLPPIRRGDYWFSLSLPPDGGHRVLKFSEWPNGLGRLLLDPRSLSGDPSLSIDWFFPSPDGRHVALGLSKGGSMQSVLHVVETDTGRILPDRIPNMMLSVVAWLPDSSGFFCNPHDPDASIYEKLLLLHHLGEDGSESQPLPARGLYVAPQLSGDGRWLALVHHLGARVEWVKDRARNGAWQPFYQGSATCFGEFVGDRYLAIVTAAAPRGRLVSIPIETAGDRSTWAELVPETKAVLNALAVVGDRILLREVIDTYSQIRILTLDGEPDGEIPLPERGTANMDGRPFLDERMFATGADDCSFVFSSYTLGPSIYRFDVRTRRLEQVGAQAHRPENLVTERLSCESADGTRVSMSILHRSDLDLSLPHPTLIYGYGGFAFSFVPFYVGLYAPFVEAGGVFVQAFLRGGAEYGVDWWESGRREHKQKTVDDLFAVAESLIARGMTTSDKLAVFGASNGGFLAAAAATQRPDLFQAVVPLVPLTDLLRLTRDSWTAARVCPEYGDPSVPAEAAWLYALSPYHNIRPSERYPATLVCCGANDSLCPPWHGRKFVAQLQAANVSNQPMLLRVWPDTGHQMGKTRQMLIEQTAEWMGFVMSQLGMTVSSTA